MQAAPASRCMSLRLCFCSATPPAARLAMHSRYGSLAHTLRALQPHQIPKSYVECLDEWGQMLWGASHGV